MNGRHSKRDKRLGHGVSGSLVRVLSGKARRFTKFMALGKRAEFGDDLSQNGKLIMCRIGGFIHKTVTRRAESPAILTSRTLFFSTGPTPDGVPDKMTSPGASSK